MNGMIPGSSYDLIETRLYHSVDDRKMQILEKIYHSSGSPSLSYFGSRSLVLSNHAVLMTKSEESVP